MVRCSCRPPGIFGVDTEPLHVLGEAAVAGGRLRAGNVGWRVDAIQIEVKLGRIGGVEVRDCWYRLSRVSAVPESAPLSTGS